MKKTLLVDKDTHTELKKFCAERNLKIVGTTDQIIKDGIELLKSKENSKAAI